eukprot:TRINITY_DN29687_c0_g1_i1.p1 TRINITY_DN29687_c0_g1~~TRINITY_DN29687_c0_g1_i1.p1  ORF type:complete len:155 (+),score=59.99 TRINITY_DN29687_c0_g1_i1:32-466(+)
MGSALGVEAPEISPAKMAKIVDAVASGLAPFIKEYSENQIPAAVKADGAADFEKIDGVARDAAEKELKDKLKSIKKKISDPLADELKDELVGQIDEQLGDKKGRVPKSIKNSAAKKAVAKAVDNAVEKKLKEDGKAAFDAAKSA